MRISTDLVISFKVDLILPPLTNSDHGYLCLCPSRNVDLARLVRLLDPSSLLPSKFNTIYFVKISYWGPKIWQAGQDYTCCFVHVQKSCQKGKVFYKVRSYSRRSLHELKTTVNLLPPTSSTAQLREYERIFTRWLKVWRQDCQITLKNNS